MKRLATLTFCLAALALLSACDGGRDNDLRTWMSEQRAQARPHVTPLAEPKPFVPADYLEQGATDPFSEEKLTQALKRDTAKVVANTALITPELNRRKEPLEAFPLDTMSMVGSMIKGGRPVALINSGALLYQVHVGDHLGQNYGRVTAITETEVKLREIVQDATGDWVERMTSLTLREGSK
ncbi:MAG TPA: pilus assembly protein PilP [Terriglobia bacterium]|nr:pilus assembly protein PilP [Terriglobia bacterium]